jgi:hypothetical protein
VEPSDECTTTGDERLHVALLEPEIAANTGSIGRMCVAAGAMLWLVRPLFCASLLQHLDWRRRLAIRQCVMRGRKLREVGSMLGVSTERARQLRNEGLAILREIAEGGD